MKLIFIFSLSFILISCERVELFPSTSEELLSNINSYKGNKAVLFNVWALWCVPCVEEFPMIAALDREYLDLEVIFISADFEEHMKEVKSFLQKNGVLSSFIKKEKDDSFISGIHSDWSGSLPFTVVYSKESGNIVDYWEGIMPESRFRMAIKIALKS